MNLLLDTHVFLWWIDDDPLPAPSLQAIRDPEHTVWLSAASAWEMTIKASLGKLRLPDRAARYAEHHRQLNGFGCLPIETAALDCLESLPFHHRDPFDRLLIAQAIARDFTLVSADATFDAYPVKRLWN